MNIKIFAILGIILLIPSYIYADNNGVWIDAKDVRGGDFGSDETTGSQDYSFPNNLEVDNELKASEVYSGGEVVSTVPYVNDKIDSLNNSLESYINNEVGNTKTWVQDQNYQERVNDACPSGQSIRKINSDGSVVCEVDNYDPVDDVSISCNRNSQCTQTTQSCANSYETCSKTGCSTTCTEYETECSKTEYYTTCEACVDGVCDTTTFNS